MQETEAGVIEDPHRLEPFSLIGSLKPRSSDLESRNLLDIPQMCLIGSLKQYTEGKRVSQHFLTAEMTAWSTLGHRGGGWSLCPSGTRLLWGTLKERIGPRGWRQEEDTVNDDVHNPKGN